MRIQHNIMSMNAYRNYNNNTSKLSKNLEKLSSGYKINRAGDDAAGLAISEKMRAQITGLTQAQANAKSGINLVQTAEGALQEVQDMLNRMVKLADQSANGTFDNETDRANLQKEVVQLKSEINRIADSANFNGIKLLNGNLENGATVGGGPMDIDSILTGVSAKQSAVAAVKTKFSVSLDGLSVKTASQATSATLSFSIGGQSINVKFTGLTKNSDNDLSQVDPNTVPASLTINGSKFNITHSAGKLTFEMDAEPTASTDAQALAGAFDITVSGTGVGGSINKGSQVISTGKVEQKATQAIATMNLSADMMKNGTAFKIGSTVYTLDFSAKSSTVAAGNTSIGVKDLLDENGKITDVNKVASLLTLAASTNADFSVGNNGSSITLQSKTGNGDDLNTIDLVKAEFSVTLASGQGSSLILQIGDTSDGFNQLSVNIDDIHVNKLGIDGVDIGTQSGAKNAVENITSAINKVSKLRGTLGATQNRLDHTINNLSVMTENIQDAEATVRDTDVAEEMMAYTKNNILVQSAQAMLAQANQVPQGVLQLLQ